MSNMPTKKYLMPSIIRELAPIAIPLLLGIVGVMVVVCWMLAIQDPIAIAYIMSSGVSILWVVFFRLGLRTLSLRSAEYCYDSEKILNYCGKYESSIDISHVFYVCALDIPFATGKGSIKIGYYVLSNTPIDTSLIDEEANGMASVEAMIKSGLVVLPVENDTNCFIHSIFCSQEIPAFPDFLVGNGTSFPSTHEHEM